MNRRTFLRTTLLGSGLSAAGLALPVGLDKLGQSEWFEDFTERHLSILKAIKQTPAYQLFSQKHSPSDDGMVGQFTNSDLGQFSTLIQKVPEGYLYTYRTEDGSSSAVLYTDGGFAGFTADGQIIQNDKLSLGVFEPPPVLGKWKLPDNAQLVNKPVQLIETAEAAPCDVCQLVSAYTCTTVCYLGTKGAAGVVCTLACGVVSWWACKKVC